MALKENLLPQLSDIASKYYVKDGQNPHSMIEWEKRDVSLKTPTETIYENQDLELPKSWSQNAAQVVASKYFSVKPGFEETSLKQLISRVVNQITAWSVTN